MVLMALVQYVSLVPSSLPGNLTPHQVLAMYISCAALRGFDATVLEQWHQSIREVLSLLE